MGLEILVHAEPGPAAVARLLERLASEGIAASVLMVDGALVHPSAPPPASFRDLRLRTPAGTVTLSRRAGGLAVLVFGNADPALVAVQQRIGALLSESA
jgi:hypothetical protein